MSSAPCCSPPLPRRRGVKTGLGVSLAATHLVEERYHVCGCVGVGLTRGHASGRGRLAGQAIRARLEGRLGGCP
jgi:hypothetical protein